MEVLTSQEPQKIKIPTLSLQKRERQAWGTPKVCSFAKRGIRFWNEIYGTRTNSARTGTSEPHEPLFQARSNSKAPTANSLSPAPTQGEKRLLSRPSACLHS